ncbi:hypothetical protein BC830DRAFT_1163628 [Chytriomyces sp. MP71]|nr:hypothetical protein BC830DRAFT_1163628 [Chytriomyces sp. MP71]
MSENRPNSGIEVAVVAWAERHGFSGSCVTSAPLTRTLEHRSLKVETVSRMCKAQLQAALRFVSHRVRSEDAASLPSARISQKLTSLKHAYADQAIRRNGLAKKRDDLALREAFVRRGIESKEASLKNASDRLLQQESHLNAFSRIVQDKRRKLALLEANEREAADLVAILNQYSLLVTSLLDLKSSGTVATLTEIQDLCSRIEVHYFHPTTKTKSESDTDIIMAVQSLTVEGSCSELLHNLTHLARFSSESLSECPLRVATASSFDTDAVNAQLDKAMRAHVSRYAQVKKLRAETEKFLLHMEQALHAIEDETDDPDVARALLLHLHAAGDLEGYRAVDTALNAYVVELENNVRRLKTEAFALKDYKERIEALEKELTRKHSLIASVMEANILSRSNITAVKNRNKQVAVTRLAVNAPTLDALVSKLYGFVSRELHALAGVRVSRPEWR